jgi:hypothetical protein
LRREFASIERESNLSQENLADLVAIDGLFMFNIVLSIYKKRFLITLTLLVGLNSTQSAPLESEWRAIKRSPLKYIRHAAPVAEPLKEAAMLRIAS